MKRFLIIFLILIATSALAADLDTFEGMAIDTGTTIEGTALADTIEGQTIVASCALGDNYQPTNDDTTTIAKFADKEWGGAGYKDTTTSHCVCKLAFKLTATGTITGLTFYAKIGPIDGNDDVTSIIGTSDGVTGVDGWAETEVEFDFSPCITLTAQH